MDVEVHARGLIQKSLGFKSKVLSVPENTSVDVVIQSLELSVSRSWLIVTVNGKTVSSRTILCEGDQIYIIPICGGG
jgi:sulfur carrier protein ThiS